MIEYQSSNYYNLKHFKFSVVELEKQYQTYFLNPLCQKIYIIDCSKTLKKIA